MICAVKIRVGKVADKKSKTYVRSPPDPVLVLQTAKVARRSREGEAWPKPDGLLPGRQPQKADDRVAPEG